MRSRRHLQPHARHSQTNALSGQARALARSLNSKAQSLSSSQPAPKTPRCLPTRRPLCTRTTCSSPLVLLCLGDLFCFSNSASRQLGSTAELLRPTRAALGLRLPAFINFCSATTIFTTWQTPSQNVCICIIELCLHHLADLLLSCRLSLHTP